MKYKNYII